MEIFEDLDPCAETDPVSKVLCKHKIKGALAFAYAMFAGDVRYWFDKLTMFGDHDISRVAKRLILLWKSRHGLDLRVMKEIVDAILPEYALS
jgi:hypothetical protein